MRFAVLIFLGLLALGKDAIAGCIDQQHEGAEGFVLGFLSAFLGSIFALNRRRVISMLAEEATLPSRCHCVG